MKNMFKIIKFISNKCKSDFLEINVYKKNLEVKILKSQCRVVFIDNYKINNFRFLGDVKKVNSIIKYIQTGLGNIKEKYKSGDIPLIIDHNCSSVTCKYFTLKNCIKKDIPLSKFKKFDDDIYYLFIDNKDFKISDCKDINTKKYIKFKLNYNTFNVLKDLDIKYMDLCCIKTKDKKFYMLIKEISKNMYIYIFQLL